MSDWADVESALCENVKMPNSVELLLALLFPIKKVTGINSAKYVLFTEVARQFSLFGEEYFNNNLFIALEIFKRYVQNDLAATELLLMHIISSYDSFNFSNENILSNFKNNFKIVVNECATTQNKPQLFQMIEKYIKQ